MTSSVLVDTNLVCDITIAIRGDSETEECFGYFNAQDCFEVEKNYSFRRKVLLVFRQVKDFCWLWASKNENKKGEKEVLNKVGLFIPPTRTNYQYW